MRAPNVRHSVHRGHGSFAALRMTEGAQDDRSRPPFTAATPHHFRGAARYDSKRGTTTLAIETITNAAPMVMVS
jgi:hypothetical protein